MAPLILALLMFAQQPKEGPKNAANLIWAHWARSDLPAVTVDPDAPKARVYFFRDEGLSASALNPDILCDGTTIAKLTKHKFFAIELEAGLHKFSAKVIGGYLNSISLMLNSGQEVYISYQSGLPGEKLKQVERDKAIKKIQKLQPEEGKNLQDKQRISLRIPQQ